MPEYPRALIKLMMLCTAIPFMPEGYEAGAFQWVGMLLLCFVLPVVITWVIGKIFRAKGIIKPGDLKIDMG